uniref:Ge1_WD40 domain-containing protein n=1 Tax=Haemonchus contortus TaxID=6289 RepID=A0A7I4XW79_HAECO
MGMGDPYVPADHLSPSSIVEKYILDGGDNVIKFANGNNVSLSLALESQTRDRDSARIHTTTISDYKGDVRALRGRFLAVQGDLIAFRFFNENTGDVIRIINRVSRNRRLIKGFSKAPVDLRFATHLPLLAVVDGESNLHVYSVAADCQDVETYMTIMNWPGGTSDSTPRVVWCPYVAENPSDPSDIVNMVALFKKNTVYVVNLSILKERGSRVTYEEALAVEEAILSVEVEEEVTAVCISPDSTAVAIARADGVVSFYVMNSNESELKFAHTWNPQMNRPIVELFFLDGARQKNQEQFWRHCLVVAEGGRRLALFECEDWRCLGRVRFESSVEIATFSVHVDPQARYAHILDIDGSNVFCVELEYADHPRFAGITQVTFSHPIVAVVPYEVDTEEKHDSSVDYSLDDEFDGDRNRNEVLAHYIAIGHRSLLQLDVHLELAEQHKPLSDAMPALKTGGEAEGDERGNEGPSDLLTVAPPAAANSTTPIDYEKLMEQLREMSDKIEQLSVRVERADSERRSAATNEHILSQLQCFKEEFSLREDRLLANVSDLIETNHRETINVVRNALNENSVAVENSIQANHKLSADAVSHRVTERLRESLTTMVVPAIERICAQLFKQLNDNFRHGLDQYLQQMRALQTATLAAVAATATPAPSLSVGADRQALAHMIKTNQIPLAFETALNQGDQTALEFVCNNVDPDEIFRYPGTLSQPVLLSLLQQLSLRLDSDTDLKFRYMEHIVDVLQPHDDDIGVMVPKVIEGLMQSLTEFYNLTANPQLKRQARVLNQLVRNLRKI